MASYDPEAFYRQVGRILETMPRGLDGKLTDEMHQWIGRADALVSAGGDILDQAQWRAAASRLEVVGSSRAVTQMRMVLHRLLAAAELEAPPGVRGSFIPAGAEFDAFAAVAKVLGTAKSDVFVVDPYMDESALTVFGGTVAEGVHLRLLADQAYYKDTLESAAARWVDQYGSSRPLQVRIAPARTLHDRAIFTDQSVAWTLTQSLKDFAKRSPGELVRADDTAELKIPAYELIWEQARVLV